MAGRKTRKTEVLLVMTLALSICAVFADATTNFAGNVGLTPCYRREWTGNHNFHVNNSQVIKLSQPGTRFFISGGPSDCKMKLYIDVPSRTRLTTVKNNSCCLQQELLFPPVVKQMGAKFMFLLSFTYAAPTTHHVGYTSGWHRAYYAMFLLIQHLSSANAAPRTPKIHYVGDSLGWDLGLNVQQWADSNTFSVGDTLVFQYTVEHDVLEVGQLGYINCDATNAIQVHNNGFTRIKLTQPGPRFFICSQLSYCNNGLKMEVDVRP